MGRHMTMVALGMLALGLCVRLFAASEDSDLKKEMEALKKEVQDLRKEKAASKPLAASVVDRAVESKYGPGAAAITRQGKLTISGLVQVWYYSIQNDRLGMYGDLRPLNGVLVAGDVGDGDSNEGNDNDSFGVRRTELRFTMDIHENVTGVIMIDPAREVLSRPAFPTNTGRGSGRNINLANVQTGAAAAGRTLQDAYINYHGVIPHHDFQVGQYKPALGEEGIRSAAELDFAERAQITQLTDSRDLGITAHGTWWDDRFQYWLGAFDGAGNWLQPAMQNRGDDNDQKDFVYRILIRPLWKEETWGSLELGMSSSFGTHGEAGDPNHVLVGLNATTGLANPVFVLGNVNGLNRRRTHAIRHYAWASYMPGGPVKGWWLRGEYGYVRDRLAPGSLVVTNNPFNNLYTFGAQNDYARPNAFSVQGWYVSTGYKLSDSVFAQDLPSWFRSFEFAFRYESFQNVWLADLVRPASRTDVFSTNVYTAGINYYIKGHNAKIQVNYNITDQPFDHDKALIYNAAGTDIRAATYRGMRNVRNDNLLVNFQVAW